MAKKQLNYKHKQFARNLVKAKGNQKEAYLMTYPECSPESAPSLASRLVSSKPQILDLARSTLEHNGVSLNVLGKKLKQKLDSQKAIIVDNNIEYVEDNTSQLKAVELAYKVHGALKDNDNSVNINVQHNQAIILDKLGSRLDAVLRMFEPLEREALADSSIYRKVGNDVKNNPQLIHNLSNDSTSESQIIDADCKIDDSQQDSDVGVGDPV